MCSTFAYTINLRIINALNVNVHWGYIIKCTLLSHQCTGEKCHLDDYADGRSSPVLTASRALNYFPRAQRDGGNRKSAHLNASLKTSRCHWRAERCTWKKDGLPARRLKVKCQLAIEKRHRVQHHSFKLIHSMYVGDSRLKRERKHTQRVHAASAISVNKCALAT